MGREISEAQWCAAREISEGEPPTRARIAAAMATDVRDVCARADAEGWKATDLHNREIRDLCDGVATIATGLSGGAARDKAEELGGDLPPAQAGEPAAAAVTLAVPEWERMEPADVLAGASAFIARQIGRLIERAERSGGQVDKAEVDGLAALSRMMDRWEAIKADQADDNIKKSDDKLADILRKIDDRIVELAVEGARHLDERRHQRGRGQEDHGGVADAGADAAIPAVATPGR